MSQHGESLTGQREDPNPHRRLQWVLGGRLIIATVLLGTTMYLALDAIRYGRFTPTFLLILISAIYGSSILFGVWLLRGRQENLVAAAITTLDVMLITGLVYLTGGAGSIFSFLYGAQILTAALTSLLEPLMMVFIGGIVGVILISMYLPIFSIAGQVSE